MPEVGLELHSSPCERRPPAETCRIRLDPDQIRPSPTAKVCTMCTPRNSPLFAPETPAALPLRNAVYICAGTTDGFAPIYIVGDTACHGTQDEIAIQSDSDGQKTPIWNRRPGGHCSVGLRTTFRKASTDTASSDGTKCLPGATGCGRRLGYSRDDENLHACGPGADSSTY